MGDFIQLILLVVAIVLLARVSSLLSRITGIPVVTIQLLVGILLGPSLFNLMGSPIVLGTWGSPGPTPLHDVLRILAEVGLIQLMFFAGLKTDWQAVKGSLRSVFSVAGYSFLITAAAVAILSRFFLGRWPEILAVSAILAPPGFGMTVYNLAKLNLSGTPSAHTIEGASALGGFLAILLMIVSLSSNYALMFGFVNMTVAVSWFMGKLIMFFAVSYFLLSRFLRRGAGNFEKRPRQMLMGYLLLVAALYAWATLHFGSFTGAITASLGGAMLVVSGLQLREKITKALLSSTASLPIGIFLILVGMEVNLREPGSHSLFLVLIFSVALSAKLAGGWLGAKEVVDSPRERVSVMMGILPPGEMGILIAGYLYSRGLVNPSIFSMTIIAVVILTMVSAALLKIMRAEKRGSARL